MTPVRPKPWVAVVLSLLATGLGHLYCGRAARGLVLFLVSILLVPAAVALALAPPSLPMLVLLVAVALAFPALVLIAAVDAGRIARRLGGGPVARDYQRPAVYALFVLAGFVFPVASTAFLRAHVIEAFSIATASMEPALRPGDRILVDKLSGGVPARGSIVVFRHRDPERGERNYVKRLVGLPGDRVEVRDGRVLVNGEPLPAPRAEPGGTPDVAPGVVPPGHVFVIGDNLPSSEDSRTFGPVPAPDLVGAAVYVLSRHGFRAADQP